MTSEVLAPGVPGLSAADVEEIIASQNEPAWLAEKRRAAWRLYESMELPDPGDEEWRRTNLREMEFPAVRVPDRGTRPDWNLDLDARDGIGNGTIAAHVVEIDGLTLFDGYVQDLVDAGLVVVPLARDVLNHEQRIRDLLGSVVRPDEWKFTALNDALWTGGLFAYVPDGLAVSLPVFFTQSLSRDGVAVFPRVLVVVGRGASVSLVNDYESQGQGASLVSAVTEIVVGDGAKVEYYDINRWGDGVLNFKTVRAIVGRDAEFTGLAAGIGSKLTKMRFDVEMPEPGATTKLLGVTFGNGKQHFDYSTLQNHHGHHTISDLQFKSALDDEASLVWYGVTRINHGASAAEANQTSRNLLLSDHAKAAPIPILEIQAYDVAKCSHGATAGPVEETETFYLESRGISKDVAEHMLVEGFFADVIARIPDEALRERVLDAVLAKAGGRLESITWDEVLSA